MVSPERRREMTAYVANFTGGTSPKLPTDTIPVSIADPRDEVIDADDENTVLAGANDVVNDVVDIDTVPELHNVRDDIAAQSSSDAVAENQVFRVASLPAPPDIMPAAAAAVGVQKMDSSLQTVEGQDLTHN